MSIDYLNKMYPPASIFINEKGNLNDVDLEKWNSSCDKDNQNSLPFFMDEDNPNIRELMDFMSYPFFSLSKNRINKIIFQYKKIEIKIVAPNEIGIPTVWDQEFLIWLTSQLSNLLNKGITPPSTILIRPSRFFKDTGKIKCGKEYKSFFATLMRLKTTTILTNIKAGSLIYSKGFSWVNDFEIVKDQKEKILGVKIELSQWFYSRCIEDRAYLAIDPAYFSLSRAIERWLYGIARKHCGANQVWTFKIETLYKLYPNQDRKFRFFKRDLVSVVKRNNLPEYQLEQGTEENNNDIIYITPRKGLHLSRRLPRDMKRFAADLA